VTLLSRARAALDRTWRYFNLRIFWQMLLAFVLVTMLTAVGLYLAGRRAINDTADALRNNLSPAHDLWAERLAGYHEGTGTWSDVEEMIAAYPLGEAWGPWEEEWDLPYVLAAPDGTILASSRGDRVGQVLGDFEEQLATPIVVDGETVGQILLIVIPRFGSAGEGRFFLPPPPRSGFIFDRLLETSVYVTVMALILGIFFSRSISRPLTELTEATRDVTRGDLSVRVSPQHAGEVGELAASFNQMTEALERADELRRNMTADVAHELRTPLSVIRGKLEGVIDGVYPATREHLEPILEETAVLTQLVEDLRLLAQAEAGHLTLDRRPVDAGDLIRDAYVSFTPLASDRGITLVLDLPVSLPRVSADWRRIAQVLGNLISNALHHTPEGGSVTLSAVAAEAVVEVTVEDTGIGISPEDLPYVFERFWRGDRARVRTELGAGSGLGLAIVRQIVELHGGEVRVESEPGRGACFSFTLPKVSAPDKE
jgi:two-component system OmpR family sensor kinase/two-component system sensor histidine kinase BaeS